MADEDSQEEKEVLVGRQLEDGGGVSEERDAHQHHGLQVGELLQGDQLDEEPAAFHPVQLTERQ